MQRLDYNWSMDRPLSPKFCRKDAYAYFVQQLPILGTTKGLLRASAARAASPGRQYFTLL